MAKVLLVEDDNNLREIYEARLSAEAYDIITAQNGEEALVVAKQEHPDLIISDVMMPRISGFEMLDILRNTDELRDTKVIMLTALGQADDQTRAGKLGADKYLVKSQVTLEDIVNTANELLGIKSAASQPESPVLQAAPVTSVQAQPEIIPAPVVGMPQTIPSPALAPAATPAIEQPPAATPQPSFVIPSAAPVFAEPMTATPQPQASAVTPAEPIVSPEPLVTAPVAQPYAVPLPPQPPVAQPVQATDAPVEPAMPSMVTVTDPDPITPAGNQAIQGAVPAPVAQPYAVPLPPQPPVAQPVQATDAPVEPAMPSTEPVQPTAVAMPDVEAFQTTAAEEATVEAQIENFAATTITPQPPAEPSVVIESEQFAQAANEQTLTKAMDELTAAAGADPEPVLPPSQKQIPGEEPQPDTSGPLTFIAPPIDPAQTESDPQVSQEPSVAANISETQAVAGHKIIKPLNSTAAPDLGELLAKEEAREQQDAAAQVGDAPIISGTPVTETPPAANTPATPPGFDPNSIAL